MLHRLSLVYTTPKTLGLHWSKNMLSNTKELSLHQLLEAFFFFLLSKTKVCIIMFCCIIGPPPPNTCVILWFKVHVWFRY
jgi:hypothetical protein